MKIRYMSDLHLEFMENGFYISPMPEDKDTTLVLAGDIHVGIKAFDHFIDEASEQFKYVIYVPGNHEYYHGVLQHRLAQIRLEARAYDNVFVLDNDSVVLDGVRFFGATFWTDGYKRSNLKFDTTIRRSHSDFKLIQITEDNIEDYTRVLTTRDYYDMFLKSVYSLNKLLNKPFDGNTVVVSHHAPSSMSSLDEYKRSILNPYFFFEAKDHIPLLNLVSVWIHGHMHNSSNYKVGNTRVLANPYGYSGYETNPDFNECASVTLSYV